MAERHSRLPMTDAHADRLSRRRESCIDGSTDGPEAI
jgi:hypothetical protein